MALKKGYGRKTIGHNISRLRRQGHSGKRALSLALAAARKHRIQAGR